MQFIGTIAIYNEIIKVQQDNLKIVAEANGDEAIAIDTFVRISDLADNVNISQEIANIYNSSNITGIEFKNKKLVLDQIKASGVNELPKIKVYTLEDNRSYFGNFFGIFLGIASIFTGCWMLGTFSGMFATSFSTSLVFGGVGEILSYSYALINGQPINFKDVLSSKGMSLGISLATAGTLYLLDKVQFIHNYIVGHGIVENMAKSGKNVGLAFAIQATTMAAAGLLSEFGRNLIDLEAIKKEAREAIKKIIEICQEKLKRIFATDSLKDIPELIDRLYKKLEAVVAGYMERFNGEGAVFGRKIATSTTSNLITGLPYLGSIISAGTDVITNTIKNSEAISEMTEETMKAILEINNNAMSTGEMLAKRLQNDFGKDESEEIVLAIKEQKYMVGEEIDYNNCYKLNKLNLREELIPRKPGIVEECIYVQEVMTKSYKDEFVALEDRFIKLIANAKQNIQKEIIESTAAVPGGILGQHFGEMIYTYAKEKIEELKARKEAQEPQYFEVGPEPKEKQKPKEEQGKQKWREQQREQEKSKGRKQDIGGGVDQEPEHSSLEDMLNEELDKYLKKSHSQFKPSSEDAFGDSPSDINLDSINFGNKVCIGGVCGDERQSFDERMFDYYLSTFEDSRQVISPGYRILNDNANENKYAVLAGRPLNKGEEGLEYIPVLTDEDYFKHQAIFFDENKIVGYTKDSVVMWADDPAKKFYQPIIQGEYEMRFDKGIMEIAVENTKAIWDKTHNPAYIPYNLYKHNCQHYIAATIKEYKKLGGIIYLKKVPLLARMYKLPLY